MIDNVAMFYSRAEAVAAADAAMPRRTRHNRPYAQSSGYHSARAGRDVWIVCAYANLVLLPDGTMYDFQRRKVVR